jgi:VWFA-related protein
VKVGFMCSLSLRFRILLYLVLFFALPSFPKNDKVQENKSDSTFRIPVNVVLVAATVKDRTGNSVTDLTAKDFKIFDDGKPQTIHTFALESSGISNAPIDQAAILTDKGISKRTNAPNPRLISIVIDDLTVYTPLHYAEIVQAVKDFIANDVGPNDHVAILSGSRKVQFPFSNDKAHLSEETEGLLRRLSLDWNFRFGSDEDALPDRAAWGIAHDEPQYMNVGPVARIKAKIQSPMVEFRTHNLIQTIKQHLRAFSHFSGTKQVVLFSDGFVAQPSTAPAQELQELIDLALRSGIRFNTISIRGVDKRGVSVEDKGIVYNWEQCEQQTDDKIDQESVLAKIAAETGGNFFFADNNMSKGLREVATHQSSYYVLSYSIPPHAADGAYHKITLNVMRPGLQVNYRAGYYSTREELTFENRKKEDLLAALSEPGNMKEIPITLAYNYAQELDSNYSVSFTANVDIHSLRFLEEDQRRENQISLILVAFDEYDHYISGLEKVIDFRLLENSYTNLRQTGLRSRVELKLPVGRYKVKAVVREDVQGKMGSITKSVEIP